MKDEQQPNQGSNRLSRIRWIGLSSGLILSITIVFVLVFWVQTNAVSLLPSHINDSSAFESHDDWDRQDISYHVDAEEGKIMAPIDQIKHLLLTQGTASRNEFHETPAREAGAGTGNKIEMMRFHKILESEIAHSIMSIQGIKTAKVLLALPGQLGSSQEFSKPSASVMVNTEQGQILKKNQIKAIIKLIAASVPKLDAEQVTVVDQRGQILGIDDSSPASDLIAMQLEYKINLEEHLRETIGNILTPIVGVDGFRAQVSADLEYSEMGRFQDKVDSKLLGSKNNQLATDKKALSADSTVISSQSEPLAVNPHTASDASPAHYSGSARRGAKQRTGKPVGDKVEPINSIKAMLRRLTIAVVVDDQKIIRTNGAVKTQPIGQNEIDRFSSLVKQAVGFDSSRGDQLTMTIAPFKKSEQAQALTDQPFWRQAWSDGLGLNQMTAGVALLLLFLGMVYSHFRKMLGRNYDAPVKKSLDLKESNTREGGHKKATGYDQSGFSLNNSDDIQQSIRAMPNDIADILLLDMPQSYQHRLEYMKKIADADAKLVAEVIKSWVNTDG